MNVHPLPHCPRPLPNDLDQALACLASLWAIHPARPRIDEEISRSWDDLLKRWSEDPSLPLLIRKKERGKARGEEISHLSGRTLIWTDNSPASWSYMLAFSKTVPTLEDVRGYFNRDKIPVAMVVDRDMKARSRYKCIRVEGESPNFQGWKVCHRHPVGLGGKVSLCDREISDLQRHFVRFLAPSNMFLVPLELGGLGELPQFTKAIGDAP
ncbi:MAG TPA: hypothetical protein VEH47_04340 [Candidatus Acidoferrales bacterium]|nr:hypothetical protein [Candidatus Acidoferrales bacterium]